MAENKNAVGKRSKKSSEKPDKENKKQIAKTKEAEKRVSPIKLEAILICVVFICLFIMISVYLNGGGIIGTALAAFLKGCFGIGAYLLPIAFILGCIVIFVSETKTINAYKLIMSIALFIFVISFTHLLTSFSNDAVSSPAEYIKAMYLNGSYKNGGLIGAAIGDALAMLISKIGAFLVFVLGSACLLVLITEKSLLQVVKNTAEKLLGFLSFEKPDYEKYEETEEDYDESSEEDEEPLDDEVLENESLGSKAEEDKSVESEEKKEHIQKNNAPAAKRKKTKFSLGVFFSIIFEKIRPRKVAEVKKPDFININKDNEAAEKKQPVKMFFEDIKAEKNNKKENEEFDIKSMNKKTPEVPVFLNSKNRVVVNEDGTVNIKANENLYYEPERETEAEEESQAFDDIKINKYYENDEAFEIEAAEREEQEKEESDAEYEDIYEDAFEIRREQEEKGQNETENTIFSDIKVNKYTSGNIDYAKFGMGANGYVEIPNADAGNVPVAYPDKNPDASESMDFEGNTEPDELYGEEAFESLSDDYYDTPESEDLDKGQEDTFFDDVNKIMADVLGDSGRRIPEYKERSYTITQKLDSVSSEKENINKREAVSIKEAEEIKEIERPEEEPDLPPFDFDEPKPKPVQKPVFEAAEKNNSIKIIQPEKTRIMKKSVDNENQEYVYPKLEFLKSNPELHSENDEVELRLNAQKLVETLASFKIDAKVINISQGPTVTRYEITVAEGTKLSKVSDLSDNLALSLAAVSVRIEAPIPGKSAVGIEIPNKKVKSVYLSEVICSEKFQKFNSRTAFAIGKDITGNVIVEDIEKMPHLLIAGATGAGKSVCINTLIMSLIYKSSPKEVRLIMVDPKVVELASYEDIPHLLIPVVTDPNKAAGALNWAVKEMMERYNLFKMTKTRNIGGYNEIAEKQGFEKMSHIVIIIDELADLMMVAKKEVENAICRLAQLARAAGIHLVIATQRPSTDVITGLIKANIPSRIAFKTSNGIDSRTILDMQGAEKLIGRGDMLLKTVRMDKPLRIQCAFVSDDEVESIVEYIKENNPCEYDESIINAIEEGALDDEAGGSGGSDVSDELTEDVISFLVRKGKASTSSIQRQFRIGYNRAARIMEELEDRGIVGKENGSKFRDVLLDKYQYEEYLDNRSNY